MKQKYLGLLLVCWIYFLTLVNSKPSDSSISYLDRKSEKAENEWKAFISYRRSFSKHLARLTKLLLAAENVTSFMDVENLEAGYWDDQLIKAIETSPNFIILLSNGTLDRCIGDVNYTDPLHQEIKSAIDSGRNIVPVFDDYTHPKVDFSPEIIEMMRFQGVEYLKDDVPPPTKLHDS